MREKSTMMPKAAAEEAEYTKEPERRLAPFPETCFVEMRLSREVILSGGDPSAVNHRVTIAIYGGEGLLRVQKEFYLDLPQAGCSEVAP